MDEDYLKEATNPHQYDSGVIDWGKEGLEDAPIRQFFREYLYRYLDVKGKSVLDIGSGMGHLFPSLKEHGALKIQGIEPSSRGVEVSRKLHPDVPVFLGTLSQAPQESRYDVATAIMCFEHIEDIQSAFAKIHELISGDGKFFLIVADEKYHSSQRFDYVVKSQHLDDGVIVVKTTRPHGAGVLSDILRPLDLYIAAAQRNGLILESQIELKPTKDFLAKEPRYAQFADSPLCHLLIFKNQLV